MVIKARTGTLAESPSLVATAVANLDGYATVDQRNVNELKRDLQTADNDVVVRQACGRSLLAQASTDGQLCQADQMVGRAARPTRELPH